MKLIRCKHNIQRGLYGCEACDKEEEGKSASALGSKACFNEGQALVLAKAILSK